MVVNRRYIQIITIVTNLVLFTSSLHILPASREGLLYDADGEKHNISTLAAPNELKLGE